MKAILLICSLFVPALAYAGDSQVAEGNLLIWALMGFAVCILMLQAIPAMIMFFGLIKGLFFDKKEESILIK